MRQHGNWHQLFPRGFSKRLGIKAAFLSLGLHPFQTEAENTGSGSGMNGQMFDGVVKSRLGGARVKAGIAQARREGRAHGRPATVAQQKQEIKKLAKKG